MASKVAASGHPDRKLFLALTGKPAEDNIAEDAAAERMTEEASA